jgi:hypothetical protein
LRKLFEQLPYLRRYATSAMIDPALGSWWVFVLTGTILAFAAASIAFSGLATRPIQSSAFAAGRAAFLRNALLRFG